MLIAPAYPSLSATPRVAWATPNDLIPTSKVPYAFTKAQKEGHAFQAVIERDLSDRLSPLVDEPDEIHHNKFLSYTDGNNRRRLSRPDIVLVWHRTKRILIVEVKLTHSRLALSQYTHYYNLLASLYPDYFLSGLEVSKTFDPWEANWPLVDTLTDKYPEFSVYLWN